MTAITLMTTILFITISNIGGAPIKRDSHVNNDVRLKNLMQGVVLLGNVVSGIKVSKSYAESWENYILKHVRCETLLLVSYFTSRSQILAARPQLYYLLCVF